MAKKYRELRERMSPESRARAELRTRTLLDAMPLYQVRQALQLSQEQLAAELRVKQSTISKVERRTDMLISTLRRFVEAMGGQLQINACFADGCVQIDQLGELRGAAGEEAYDETQAETKLAEV